MRSQLHRCRRDHRAIEAVLCRTRGRWETVLCRCVGWALLSIEEFYDAMGCLKVFGTVIKMRPLEAMVFMEGLSCLYY